MDKIKKSKVLSLRSNGKDNDCIILDKMKDDTAVLSLPKNVEEQKHINAILKEFGF